MSVSQPQNLDLLVEKIVSYFADNDTSPENRILHPDPHVEEMAQQSTRSFRKASVLIPILKPSDQTESQIVLTVRSADLSSHAGQVSLPGGTREEHDETDVATALRETEEEIGLNPDKVEVLGQLGDILLPSGFQVTPVIGLVQPAPELTPCPIEVHEIFTAPTTLLLSSSSYVATSMEYGGKPRQILEINYQGYRIWGATAVILHHLALQLENQPAAG